MLWMAKVASVLLGLAFLGADSANAGCCCAKKGVPTPSEKRIDPNVKTREVTISVSGMTCASCEAKVQKALSSIPWVQKAQVDRAKGQASLTVEAEKYDEKALLKALDQAGYGGKVVK